MWGRSYDLYLSLKLLISQVLTPLIFSHRVSMPKYPTYPSLEPELYYKITSIISSSFWKKFRQDYCIMSSYFISRILYFQYPCFISSQIENDLKDTKSQNIIYFSAGIRFQNLTLVCSSNISGGRLSSPRLLYHMKSKNHMQIFVFVLLLRSKCSIAA